MKNAIKTAVTLLALASFWYCQLAEAGNWVLRAVGTQTNLTDHQAPNTPSPSVGDTVFIATGVNGNGGVRTLSVTPTSTWTVIDSVGPTSTTLQAVLLCRAWQMGDVMPTLDWSGGDSNQVTMQAVAFHGPSQPNCSTMVDVHQESAAGGTTNVNFPNGAITPSANNELILAFGWKQQDGSSVNYSSITCPTGVPTQSATYTNNSNFLVQWQGCYAIQTTATAITDTHYTVGGSQENTAASFLIIALKEQEPSAAPAYLNGPGYAGKDASTITETFTADSAGRTNRCGLYLPGVGAPTAAQIAAGTNAHGTASVASTGSAQTLDIATTDGTPAPFYQPFCILDAGGSNYSVVHASLPTCVIAPTNKAFWNCPGGLTSIAAGGAVSDLNVKLTAAGQPNWAIGDPQVCDVYTHNIPAGTQQFLFGIAMDGTASYQHGTGERAYAACDDYRVSAGHYATVDNANNFLGWWDQDPPIACTPPFNYVLKTNVAMNVAPNPGNLDFVTVRCAHPLGDTLTAALTAGTLPTGTSITAGVMSGNATVENQSGAAETVTATSSVTGGTGAQLFTVYPLTSKPMSDCTTAVTIENTCRNKILGQYVNAITILEGFSYSATVPSGSVISQSPAAGVATAPYATETLTISLGPVPPRGDTPGGPKGVSAHGASPFL